MNATLLEQLYVRLGRPWWFWPVVMAALFVLFVLASSLEGIHE